MDECLGCFCALVFVNNPATDVGVQIAFQDSAFVSCGNTLGRRLSALDADAIFNFLEEALYSFPQWLLQP